MTPPLNLKASVVVPCWILILQFGSAWSSVCNLKNEVGCVEDGNFQKNEIQTTVVDCTHVCNSWNGKCRYAFRQATKTRLWTPHGVRELFTFIGQGLQFTKLANCAGRRESVNESIHGDRMELLVVNVNELTRPRCCTSSWRLFDNSLCDKYKVVYYISGRKLLA